MFRHHLVIADNMLKVIEQSVVLDYLRKYYGKLAKTGYVKDVDAQRLVFWLFIIDFAEQMYLRLTDSDYTKINKAIINLFSSGSCILPYPYTRKDNLVVPNPWYLGKFNFRITEEGAWKRITEDEQYRFTQ